MSLIDAIKNLNFTQFEDELKKGAKVDSEALNCALLSKRSDLIDILIKLGAQPDEHTLNCALLYGHPYYIDKVLALGAKPDEYTISFATIKKCSARIQKKVDLRGEVLSEDSVEKIVQQYKARFGKSLNKDELIGIIVDGEFIQYPEYRKFKTEVKKILKQDNLNYIQLNFEGEYGKLVFEYFIKHQALEKVQDNQDQKLKVIQELVAKIKETIKKHEKLFEESSNQEKLEEKSKPKELEETQKQPEKTEKEYTYEQYRNFIAEAKNKIEQAGFDYDELLKSKLSDQYELLFKEYFPKYQALEQDSKEQQLEVIEELIDKIIEVLEKQNQKELEEKKTQKEQKEKKKQEELKKQKRSQLSFAPLPKINPYDGRTNLLNEVTSSEVAEVIETQKKMPVQKEVPIEKVEEQPKKESILELSTGTGETPVHKEVPIEKIEEQPTKESNLELSTGTWETPEEIAEIQQTLQELKKRAVDESVFETLRDATLSIDSTKILTSYYGGHFSQPATKKDKESEIIEEKDDEHIDHTKSEMLC